MEIPDLPHMEDIWGRIVLDAWRGGSGAYAIRRDDGFLDELCVLEAEMCLDIRPDHAEALARVQGRVLDLGCGPGRQLLWLQRHGHEVTGIEVSPGALQVARERGARDVRAMSIDELDFPARSFDSALFMGNTLGTGCRLAGVERRLGQLHPVVRAGGTAVASICQPGATENPVHLAYHARRKAEGRYPGELLIRLEYQDHAGPWFDFTLANLASITEAATHTGWEVDDVLGDEQRGYAVLTRR